MGGEKESGKSRSRAAIDFDRGKRKPEKQGKEVGQRKIGTLAERRGGEKESKLTAGERMRAADLGKGKRS